MFWHEKYYSPSLGREVDYSEFKEFSCEKINSIMDQDTEIFERMLERDPCEVRKKLTEGFFTYSMWLIADNLNLYECAMKHRTSRLSDLRRRAYDVTKRKKFEIEYSIESEVPIPIEKVIEGKGYIPIKSENNTLAGIKIKDVIADDLVRVDKLGERKLNQFLGYLDLYSNDLSIKVGQWNASYTDVCGKSIMVIGSEKARIKQIVWDNLPPLQLNEIENAEFDGGIVLDLLYVASLSEYQEMWRGAFLNLYLALEFIVQHFQLDQSQFEKYKWIRNSIVHSTLDSRKLNDKIVQYLEKEFDSKTPDWDDLDIQVKLGNWTRYLKGEIRKILIKNVS